MESSIALENSNLLCFHRKDVENAVCTLAVDAYGEFPTDSNDYENADDNITKGTGDMFNEYENEWMSPASFVPKISNKFDFNPTKIPSFSPVNDRKQEKIEEDKGKDSLLPISTSAAVRGDRAWTSGSDAYNESISLCCGRCCSPLGYVSLGTVDTWRFWKHRLAVNKNKIISCNNRFSVEPFGSCTSFLARELVRYAESKAIFTFVVRSENYKQSHTHGAKENSHENDCILLRLLSWESTMATCYKEPSSCQGRTRELQFRKVAKIVFEETKDPTVKAGTHKESINRDSSVQWFWGGVDLCCIPQEQTPARRNDTNNKIEPTPSDEIKSNSTVKLQVPQNEYDQVLCDLISGQSYFSKDTADATILIKMGGLSDGLKLTAVAV